MMMTKTTIALAAALFLAVGTAAQASDSFGSHERQGEGFSFHTGPLGRPLGGRSWWAYQTRIYGYVPRHEYIRHHRPVR
jgi:Spy/CpxP family protein refolding chaperone